MTDADKAYDRLHGCDGLVQAAESPRLKDELAEAEFHIQQLAEARDRAERRAEAAERELERIKAAADLVGHQAACLVDPCDCWMSDLAPLLEDWSR